MLKVKNLVKIYKIGKGKETVKALDNVSIDFPEKGLVFLLGKSGSGKSTLLNAIGGLDTFDRGEIIIKGKSSKDFSQSDFDSYRNTFIGFIFQEYNILEEFSVAKNLGIALELQGKRVKKEEVNKLLEQVDMLKFAKRKPNQLSGGQKQRVAIARALIKNPEIIMADEPTGALDSNTGKQVMDTLKKLSQEKLVIIVSHDREFAEIYGDRIIELKDGKIIQDVTKKVVESKKTDSGLSIIDNKIIHIKKGIQLTDDDLIKINTALKMQTDNSDIIISLDENANKQVKKASFITDDGNKESFLQTTQEDLKQKQYDAKSFKLIKSKLKFKDSFKMGASALKNKVGKLLFTIFLSFIAFGIFGVIDTFSSFNRASAIFHTVEQFNQNSISILKEQKGEYTNDASVFKESDIEALKEKFPDIEFKKVVGANIMFGGSYYNYINDKILQIQNLNNSSSNPSLIPYMSGMVHITESELTKFNLSIVAGRLPNANNEICISKHIFDAFKTLNSTVNLTYNDILTTYKQCSVNNAGTYTIVGIIDDGSDYSEYMNMDSAKINVDPFLNQKISRELDFGFGNMLYITEAKYDELLQEPVNMGFHINYDEVDYIGYTIDTDKLTTLQQKYEHECNLIYQQYERNYEFFYINGSIINNNEFVSLKNDEAILKSSIFDNLFGTTSKEERDAYLNSATSPITIELQSYYNNGGNVEYQTQKTLTIVGHYTGYNKEILINNETLNSINSIVSNNRDKYFQYKNDDKTYYSYPINVSTIKDDFFSRYDIISKEEFVNKYVSYYKNNGSLYENGEIKELGENEIMLREYMLKSIAQGEELKRLIDSGLTIKLSTDSNGKNVVATLKVVGISSDYTSDVYTSSTTFNNTFNDYISGFDYSIALLSSDSNINEKFIKYCETFNNDGYKFTVQTGSTPVLDQFGDILNSVTEVFLYVGIAFAVFAALLLMNFISTSISYKKREIGILRALGARGSDVFGIFFKESTIIAMINFVLATLATFITCGVINNVIINKLGMDLVLLSVGIRQLVLMFGISLLTAFIASFIPVFKISRKKPIDAINNR